MWPVSTNLQMALSRMVYPMNEHWIELHDAKGSVTRLRDNALARYDCPVCAFFFLTESNLGDFRCPVCSEPMARTWQRVQVCFVPERESDFDLGKA